jgi:hypothetical protein
MLHTQQSPAPIARLPDRDAVKIGELYRDARASMADSVRYLVEAGHRLIAKKDSLGHGRWLQWLEANAEVLGFDTPRTPQLLMKAASKYEVDFAFDDEEALQISRQIWGNSVSCNTGDNEWYTPARFIDLARKVMGGIDLDPASSDIAQETVQATTYFTKDDDGLSREWAGKVWLNPPYAELRLRWCLKKLLRQLGLKCLSIEIEVRQ